MTFKKLFRRPLRLIPFAVLIYIIFGARRSMVEIPTMGYITMSVITLLLFVLINNRYIARNAKKYLEDQITLRTKELRESEAIYKSLVDNIPGVTYRCLYDKDWTMLFMSDEIERLSGYPASDFINNHIRTFKSILHRDNPASTNDRIAQALKLGKSYREEYRIIDKEGHVRWVLDKGTGLLNDKEEVRFIVGVMIEITEEKKIAQAKEKLEDQYRQAQKMESIGRLAGGIAHDLNNLLTPVMGYADLLTPIVRENEEALEYTQGIIEASIRARELVQQLLAYSRHQKLNFTRQDINSTLYEFSRLLKKSLKENISLVIKTDPQQMIINGDRTQMEQLIMNLVINAQDAMGEKGTISIETRKENDWAIIIVSDTGKGMNKETIEHIYEPFYSTKGQRGTGLGLATVYGIITQHKGFIKVESKPNEGTRFIISLPIDSSIESLLA